ncbi:hypothetical protein [Kitasatospora herbaricolor]|uniref:Uncharacterized protein n=1 Tax=Kitasatospora herbaricolor TaxID=68217 RepID=A0ABZ1WH94_9ACTN|nr:hypothetical protein [Kitasatospora herbaricolor]
MDDPRVRQLVRIPLAEFGIGRSTAYRLLDLAAVAEAIEGTLRVRTAT